jgi:hypothetical protein
MALCLALSGSAGFYLSPDQAQKRDLLRAASVSNFLGPTPETESSADNEAETNPQGPGGLEKAQERTKDYRATPSEKTGSDQTVDLAQGNYNGGRPTVSIGDRQYGLSSGAGRLYLYTLNGLAFVKSGKGEFASIDSKGTATLAGLNVGSRLVSSSDKAMNEDSVILARTISPMNETLPSAPAAGKMLSVVNVGTNKLSVVSGNFKIGNSSDLSEQVTVEPGHAIQFCFDGWSTPKAWRVISR